MTTPKKEDPKTSPEKTDLKNDPSTAAGSQAIQSTLPGMEPPAADRVKGKSFTILGNPNLTIAIDPEGMATINSEPAGIAECIRTNLFLTIDKFGIPFRAKIPMMVLLQKKQV